MVVGIPANLYTVSRSGNRFKNGRLADSIVIPFLWSIKPAHPTPILQIFKDRFLLS